MATGTEQMQSVQVQLGTPWPLAFGPVRAVGNKLIEYSLSDGTRIAAFGLGEGEWDGCDRLNVNGAWWDPTDIQKFHFHAGRDGTLGWTMNPISYGPDQGVDSFFADVPLPHYFTFSRLAYYVLKVPPDAGAPSAELTVFGDWRTLKCRQFDANGELTAYAYTTNVAQQILEVLLRLHVKRQFTISAGGIEGLTSYERARIGFSSFADAAAYCAELIDNGKRPRFVGSFAFPNATSLQSMLDQMLLSCRGYLREIGSQICLFIDQPRAVSFVIKGRHLAAPIEPSETRQRGAADQILAKYNDLNPPQQSQILAPDASPQPGAVRTAGTVELRTATDHGVQTGDTIIVADIDDASFNGTFVATIAAGGYITYAQPGLPDATSGNGWIGLNEYRFQQRAPKKIHYQHQWANGLRGANLSREPHPFNLELDFGNSTAHQVDRLCTYRLVGDLGPDVTPYHAPIDVTASLFADSVDDDGAVLPEIQAGDLVRIDRSASEEFQGTYEVMENTVPRVSSEESQGDNVSDLLLYPFFPEAFTDETNVSNGGGGTPGGGIILPTPDAMRLQPGAYSGDGWNNPQSAADASDDTYADVATETDDCELMVYNFPAFSTAGYASLLLRCRREILELVEGAAAKLKISLDSGATWAIENAIAVADAAPVTMDVLLDLAQATDRVRAKLVVPASTPKPNGYCGRVSGSMYWSGQDNVLGPPDYTYAEADADVSGGRIYYPTSGKLYCTGFGVAVPAEAEITGIQFTVRRYADWYPDTGHLKRVWDQEIEFILHDVAVANFAITDRYWLQGDWEEATFGGPGVLPVPLTPADIDYKTGISIAATLEPDVDYERAWAKARIDSVEMKVYYQLGVGQNRARCHGIWLEARP